MNSLDDLLIVGYAIGEPYHREARRLIASLNRLGLDHEIEFVGGPTIDWVDAVRQKPWRTLGWRLKYPTRPLLYVDVDAVFHADPRPLLRCAVGDLAVHVLEGNVLSGTVFIPADTPDTYVLLATWAQQDFLNPDLSSPQRVLQRAYDLAASGAEVAKYTVGILPPELCWIFDRSEEVYGKHEPVIEHLQASRDYRTPNTERTVLHEHRQARIRELAAAGLC